MSSLATTILPFDFSDPENAAQSEALLDRAFGIGRQTKTSYRFREGEQPADNLSLGIYLNSEGGRAGPGRLCAIISYWHLRIGREGHQALMLGPLAVEPDVQGKGMGRELMRHSLEKAKTLGHSLIILVGDAPYYSPFGFVKVPEGRLHLPGPVEPGRLLYQELVSGAFEGVSGLVLSPSRHASRG